MGSVDLPNQRSSGSGRLENPFATPHSNQLPQIGNSLKKSIPNFNTRTKPATPYHYDQYPVNNSHNQRRYENYGTTIPHANYPTNNNYNERRFENGKTQTNYPANYNCNYNDRRYQNYGTTNKVAPAYYDRSQETFNNGSRSNSNEFQQFPRRPFVHKPWVTPEMLTMIRARNEAEKWAGTSGNRVDMYNFKKLRNEVATKLSKAKFDYQIEMSSVKTLFHCDPCDKGFEDQSSLDSHKAEHMTCKLDGCTFTAHPKIIVKHIQMQHSTDLYHKIAGYDTPDDIKDWVNDRKKNFPTTENLERKRMERKERLQRGERITKQKPKLRQINVFGLAKRKVNHITERNNELRRRRLGVSHQVVNVSGNTSEVVELKSFYATVKKNSKGKLDGKELTLWTSNTTTTKKRKEKDSMDGSDSEDGGEGDNFTDEEEEAERSKFRGDTNLLPDNIIKPSTATVTDTSETASEVPGVNNKKAAKSPASGLQALMAYSSDSDMEDGEIREEPGSDDDEGPLEIKTVSTKDSESEYTEPFVNNDETNGITKAPMNRPTSLTQKLASNIRQRVKTRKTPNVSLKTLISKGTEDNVQPTNVPQGQEDEKVSEVSDGAKSTLKTIRRIPRRPKPKIVRRRVRQPLMLEHLLAPEIRFERNALLQVFRFVVDNNFMDGPLPVLLDQGENNKMDITLSETGTEHGIPLEPSVDKPLE